MPRNLDRDSIDFGSGKIGPLFRALFFPTLIGMIFNSLLTLIDGIFVGQGVGANGIAAVNIVAPLFMICTGIGLMMGIGASVIASIRLSEKNVKGARIILTQSFLAGSVAIGLVSIASLLFTRSIVYTLGGSPELEQNCIDYLFWLAPGFIAFMIECIGMMLIRLDGSPRYAMWVQIVSAVLNIVLDYIMIFPMDMGVKGAAIATSMSAIVGMVMVFVYFTKLSDKLKFYRLKMSYTSLLLTLRNVWYISKIGFATFLIEIAMSITMLTGNYVFMSLAGEQGVAAFSIACYLFPVVFSIANAVAQSAQPIISFNYGTHSEERVRRALKVAMLTAIICGSIVSLSLWLGATPIVSAFLHVTEPAYALAIHGIPVFATCAIIFAINVTFIGYYQSIEKSWQSIMFTALRGIIFLIPCFFLLPRFIGIDGAWLAITTSETLTLAVIFSYYRTHKKVVYGC